MTRQSREGQNLPYENQGTCSFLGFEPAISYIGIDFVLAIARHDYIYFFKLIEMEEKKSFLITVIRENCFVMGREKVL